MTMHAWKQTSRFGVLLFLSLTLLWSGCGYHTNSKAAHMPADAHTIAIPAFVNATTTYHVEQLLTEAVVREFQTRTQYRVVNRDDSDADTTLRGTVISAQAYPVTYDSQTGRVSSAIVTVGMKVFLTDRKGKVLYSNPSYSFRQQYQLSQDPYTFFQEQTPALDRLAREFARTLVSDVLEGY